MWEADCMVRRVVVVPCFNEAARLDAGRLALVLDDTTTVILVDDGSTDDTRRCLDAMARAHPAHVEVLALPRNQGKAEAVRTGLLHALQGGADVVGYLDADLTTPPSEMHAILAALDDPTLVMAMGARVALLGRTIERRPWRHLLGRVFATFASLALRLPVYDTQCGAKALRNTPATHAALAEPFRSPWIFDVELIGRLLRGTRDHAPVPPAAFVEVPLRAWRDVRGSKLRTTAMLRAGLDLVRISWHHRRRP
jgi:glycosyltransferase involved in cell wall biosynthesis